MKNLFIVMAILLSIFLTSGCAFATRIDGPYRGRVIDADTREPIEGVVVLGVWYKQYPSAAGAISEYHDAMETITDKNGDFEIKGLGLLVMSNVIPMDVLIFKAGYEYDSGSWRGLKSRGWTGEYEEIYDPIQKTKVKKRVYDPKKKVIWEGDKAIIPLRKLTTEERKKQLRPPSPPDEAIKGGKARLILEEIEKDNKELIPLFKGRIPFQGIPPSQSQ